MIGVNFDPIRKYTLREEIANSITSGIASALSVAALVVMVVHAAPRGDRWHVTGCAIFGASLIVSNLSSTLYHAIAPPRAKRVFRIFDHLSIYFLIAGTYMPFVLVSLRGAWGWTLCGIVWGLAALGLAIKLTPLARVRGLSTGSWGGRCSSRSSRCWRMCRSGASGCFWTADSATRLG